MLDVPNKRQRHRKNASVLNIMRLLCVSHEDTLQRSLRSHLSAFETSCWNAVMWILCSRTASARYIYRQVWVSFFFFSSLSLYLTHAENDTHKCLRQDASRVPFLTFRWSSGCEHTHTHTRSHAPMRKILKMHSGSCALKIARQGGTLRV